MKNIIYKLKCRKGEAAEATIAFIIITILVMALLVLSITFFAAYTKISKVNSMAQEIMRIAEIKGHTGIDAEIANIKANGVKDAVVTITGDYIPGTNRIQLGGNITVTVKTVANIGIGNIATLPIPITGKAIGISEQYWK